MHHTRRTHMAVSVLSESALRAVCIERRLDTVFVLGLRVHPQHHGRGIGARLTVSCHATRTAGRQFPPCQVMLHTARALQRRRKSHAIHHCTTSTIVAGWCPF